MLLILIGFGTVHSAEQSCFRCADWTKDGELSTEFSVRPPCAADTTPEECPGGEDRCGSFDIVFTYNDEITKEAVNAVGKEYTCRLSTHVDSTLCVARKNFFGASNKKAESWQCEVSACEGDGCNKPPIVRDSEDSGDSVDSGDSEDRVENDCEKDYSCSPGQVPQLAFLIAATSGVVQVLL